MWRCDILYSYLSKPAILSKKYDATAFIYIINKYKSRGKAYVTSMRIVRCKTAQLRRYVEEVKEDKNAIDFEAEGNILYYTYRFSPRELRTTPIFDITPELIFVKPLIFTPDSLCRISLISVSRKAIQDFLNRLKRRGKVIRFSIVQEKVKTVFQPYVAPRLTEIQKNAALLAYQQGYYEIPKRILIERLAQMSKKSKSTFHDNLKRAESKIVKWVLENFM